MYIFIMSDASRENFLFGVLCRDRTRVSIADDVIARINWLEFEVHQLSSPLSRQRTHTALRHQSTSVMAMRYLTSKLAQQVNQPDMET